MAGWNWNPSQSGRSACRSRMTDCSARCSNPRRVGRGSRRRSGCRSTNPTCWVPASGGLRRTGRRVVRRLGRRLGSRRSRAGALGRRWGGRRRRRIGRSRRRGRGRRAGRRRARGLGGTRRRRRTEVVDRNHAAGVEGVLQVVETPPGSSDADGLGELGEVLQVTYRRRQDVRVAVGGRVRHRLTDQIGQRIGEAAVDDDLEMRWQPVERPVVPSTQQTGLIDH